MFGQEIDSLIRMGLFVVLQLVAIVFNLANWSVWIDQRWIAWKRERIFQELNGIWTLQLLFFAVSCGPPHPVDSRILVNIMNAENSNCLSSVLLFEERLHVCSTPLSSLGLNYLNAKALTCTQLGQGFSATINHTSRNTLNNPNTEKATAITSMAKHQCKDECSTTVQDTMGGINAGRGSRIWRERETQKNWLLAGWGPLPKSCVSQQNAGLATSGSRLIRNCFFQLILPRNAVSGI